MDAEEYMIFAFRLNINIQLLDPHADPPRFSLHRPLQKVQPWLQNSFEFSEPLHNPIFRRSDASEAAAKAATRGAYRGRKAKEVMR
jgi:hypothetical protein